MTYHLGCNWSNTTGATSGAETAYITAHVRPSPVFSGVRVARRSLFVHFILAIVLSVLRFADSYYSFGIFKFFLTRFWPLILAMFKNR